LLGLEFGEDVWGAHEDLTDGRGVTDITDKTDGRKVALGS